MRAYLNNDTFVKIEYTEMKAIFVIASPIEVDGKVYIVEILKDITKSGNTVCNFNGNSNRVNELIRETNRKVMRDELTGAYNRRYIKERFAVDINLSNKGENSLSIIVVDIDHFKNINDTYGHAIGDKVLADFTSLIMNSIRKATDWVGRYGGDEFIIVLNNTDSKTVEVVAEKIRKTLEKTTFTNGDISIKMTSSFGVCDINDAKADLASLISKADNSLFKAKLSGRNRIVS
jgi:two-component system, cell cycle response regulator